MPQVFYKLICSIGYVGFEPGVSGDHASTKGRDATLGFMATTTSSLLEAAHAPSADLVPQQDGPCASHAQDRAAALERLRALARHLGREAAAQAMRASTPPALLHTVELDLARTL